jgi:hypothetical protein
MTFKRSFSTGPPAGERRSGLNRRWIKTPYAGEERRKGDDRRSKPRKTVFQELDAGSEERAEALEQLALANAVRLEALVRMLVKKAVISDAEMEDMLERIRIEHQNGQIEP